MHTHSVIKVKSKCFTAVLMPEIYFVLIPTPPARARHPNKRENTKHGKEKNTPNYASLAFSKRTPEALSTIAATSQPNVK